MTTSQQPEGRRSESESDGTTVETASSAEPTDADAVEPAAVRAAIHSHGERIKQRELREALHQLDATEELTEPQRRIVESMATAILDELLSTPDAVLARTDDPETLRTVIELFDPTD